MKLSKLHIQNFRKLNDVDITIDKSTFLIGANNAGKTSTLTAIEYLLSDKNCIDLSDRSKFFDSSCSQYLVDESPIIIEGEFIDVPLEILAERGFNRERLLKYTKDDGTEDYKFLYRVKITPDGKKHREIKVYPLKLKSQFSDCKKYQDFVDAGASADSFAGKSLTKKLNENDSKELLLTNPELFEIDSNDDWFENPGGISSNVLSVLPRYLKINADVLLGEMQPKSGSLHAVLSTLFEDVRDNSQNYKDAVSALERLQNEMDPNNSDTDFGKLMSDLNHVVDSVFPQSSINVKTDLSKPETLKPQFDIELRSNITTKPELQGTGLIRSVVFALLKFKQQWDERNYHGENRGLIIGFEEPELFLHPNAANNMRDIIYELACDQCQIIATTHSPYMIDLSKSESQVLNKFSVGAKEYSNVIAFNHSLAFKKIEEDDKAKIKMLQKIDDYVARAFFAKKVLIVEGDTENIVFKKTIDLMPDDVKKEVKAYYQIIKASGKAVIISLVKYFLAMNVDIFVVHDEDADTPGAFKMNEPILKALAGDSSKRFMMHNCIEDALGYTPPTSEKPFNAYKFVDQWNSWDDVPNNWKEKMKIVFSEFASEL